MHIYYVANARMPNEKAHGIQIAKTCESFIEAGHTVTLVVPARKTATASMKEFYGLRVDVPCVRLGVPDWYLRGPVGFFISSLFFMRACNRYLRSELQTRKDSIIYTVDMDSFSATFLPALGVPVYSEMHGIKPSTVWTRHFFARVSGVVAINTFVRDELVRTFGMPESRVLVEPNGIDVDAFALGIEPEVARARVGITSMSPIAMYIGRVYAWKGMGILRDAAAYLQEAVRIDIVGGTPADFDAHTTRSAEDMLHFHGQQPATAIPLWLAAADVLLVLGTKENEASYRYTSPMKAFEYMAARRPIVASDTPALREIFDADEVTWYEPDDAQSLAQAIQIARTKEVPDSLSTKARYHGWPSRGERILAFIERVGTLQ